MQYKLGSNVEIGQQILIGNKFYKIYEKDKNGIVVANKQETRTMNYGDKIDGWKNK